MHLMFLRFLLARRSLAGVVLLLGSGSSWAAYDCNVSVASVSVLYTTGTDQDTNGSVTLTCTRAATDGNSLTYRLKADNGINATGNQRRGRLGATGNRLNYSLTRGSIGGAATCTNNGNWRAPNGANNTMQGTLAFGAALTASVTWGFCARLRGNQGSPTAGAYTDTVQVFAQYPGTNAGALTSSVSLDYRAGVGNACVFNTYPNNLAFNYASFSPTPQTNSQNFDLRCSNGLFWSLDIDPASNTLLGLDYTVSTTPASGTGTGNDQAITLTGTLPANQAGTCAMGACSATQAHVLTVTY